MVHSISRDPSQHQTWKTCQGPQSPGYWGPQVSQHSRHSEFRAWTLSPSQLKIRKHWWNCSSWNLIDTSGWNISKLVRSGQHLQAHLDRRLCEIFGRGWWRFHIRSTLGWQVWLLATWRKKIEPINHGAQVKSPERSWRDSTCQLTWFRHAVSDGFATWAVPNGSSSCLFSEVVSYDVTTSLQSASIFNNDN